MKVFISHSSKDAEVAKLFSCFLKNCSFDIEIFCSSISGIISQGDDFVSTIEKGLKIVMYLFLLSVKIIIKASIV